MYCHNSFGVTNVDARRVYSHGSDGLVLENCPFAMRNNNSSYIYPQHVMSAYLTFVENLDRIRFIYQSFEDAYKADVSDVYIFVCIGFVEHVDRFHTTLPLRRIG